MTAPADTVTNSPVRVLNPATPTARPAAVYTVRWLMMPSLARVISAT